MQRQDLYDSGKYLFLAFFSFTIAFYLTVGYLFYTITDACSGIDCFRINEHTAWQIVGWTIGLSLPLYLLLRVLLSTTWGTWLVKTTFWLCFFLLAVLVLVILL
ncbi:MAG: hypothetical protein KBD46_00765 [Candidatus Levybacteria bacterium]|nr:hypothetical protein [Candidatus Levybacteria bacterium]